MNEEEVKTKIVLPFLHRLGLDLTERNLEHSFSLHFGRHQLKVDGVARPSGTVGARLDILVRNAGLPLLIVEVKESAHDLSDADRDQAISYARLVHPIAPYALTTNGRDHRLYDSISKSEIKTGDFKIKSGYEVVISEAAHNEAIDLFLGYSPHNLLRFCEAQVAEQLRPLIGSPDDLTKKYIPELTIPRTDLRRALAAFEQGQANGFLLLADSGRGKTSALCDYAQSRLNQGKPTLFFAGNRLEGNFLAALTDEFNWVFTEQVTSAALVKRLDRITRGAPAVIVLDALDEWSYPQRAESLLGFLTGARNLNIKVVVSCKSGAWESISRPRGSDLGFASYLFRDGATDTEGFNFGPMRGSEFFPAINRYREVFGVRGAFEDKVLDEARQNPFLLRVMFAVAARTGQQLLTFSSREFFERYFDLVLRLTGNRDVAEAQLLGIAQSMDRRNRSPVVESELRTDLSLPPSDSLLPALFEQNVLQRAGGGVMFYFQQLRDYLIAFRLRRWTEVPAKELAAVIPVGVVGEALTFYLRNATEAQIRAVVGPTIVDNAEQYLKLYGATLDRHFPALRNEFAPGEGRPIGFIAEYVVPQFRLGGYGFKLQRPGEPKIHLVPVEKFFSKSNLLHFAGAGGLFHAGSTDGFAKRMNVRVEVIEHEIIRQMEEILKDRRLNFRDSPPLVHEAVIRLVKANPDTFPQLFDTEGRVVRFPLHTSEIRAELRRAKLRWHFERELTEQKRRDGRIKETWNGDFVSYSGGPLSPTERTLIETRVAQAMTAKHDPEWHGVSINLRELEEALTRYGVHADFPDLTIDQPPWPGDYYLAENLCRNYQIGQAILQRHLGEMLYAFLTEYARVIDANFPTLKHAFELRAQLPLRLFVDFQADFQRRWYELDGHVTAVMERLSADATNEVILCAPGELVFDREMNVSYQGRSIPGPLQTLGFSLHSFAYSLGIKEPLHDLIYERIRDEWPAVRDEIRRMEGVPKTGR